MVPTPFRVTLLTFFLSTNLPSPEFNIHIPWGLSYFSSLSQLIPKWDTNLHTFIDSHLWETVLAIFVPEMSFLLLALYSPTLPAPGSFSIITAPALRFIPVILTAPYAKQSNNSFAQTFKSTYDPLCCSVITGSVPFWIPCPNSFVISHSVRNMVNIR